MSFFDDDPFQDIVREFFGGDTPQKRQKNTIISGEEEDRTIDFVEDEDYIYLVFELPGYSEKDLNISVEAKELKIESKKTSAKCSQENIQDYLTRKLCSGIYIKKILPNFIDPKNFKTTMKNGVLEVTFNKR